MHKKGFTRVGWIIVLIVYLFSLSTMLYYVGLTYAEDEIKYTTIDRTVYPNFVVNIVTGIQILPTWLNIIFVLIPFGILVYILVIGALPTVNLGA
jgi:hypothetical protein